MDEDDNGKFRPERVKDSINLFSAGQDNFRFNLFYWSTKSTLLGMKCESKHPDLLIFVVKLNKDNCQPLEVVGRGSKTQLHVAKNLNKIN